MRVTGLTSTEVSSRMSQGKVNITHDRNVRPLSSIIVHHVFTLFNLVNVFLASLIFIVGEYQNATFLFIVIFNTGIGIFQEVKAKYALSRLRVMNQATVDVIRDGVKQTIDLNAIVLDDTLILVSGMQLPVDGKLMDGSVEVDESMLTGESRFVTKTIETSLLSGSLIMSGEGLMHVTTVGQNTYMNQYMKEAKAFKLASSQLKATINQIIKAVTWVMFPLGILLFLTRLFLIDAPLNEAILTSVAGMIGMIPEGLVLLISMSLMLGAIKMARQQALVQELPAIEMLARTNIICVDKTGTITTGNMSIHEIVTEHNESLVSMILSTFAKTLPSHNQTQEAMQRHFIKTPVLEVQSYIDFSSVRKWSAICVGNKTYVMGAFDRICHDPKVIAEALSYTKLGKRVLALVEVNTVLTKDDPIEDEQVLALICFNEDIRYDAKTTIDYFKRQGVEVKVISGDHPDTLTAIALSIGLENFEAMDASSIDFNEHPELIDQYDLFGRVSPQQKLEMVTIMQENANTVAMIGDGVNDVLALKQANCSIAMANGSEAARLVSQIVLMDSRFSSLKQVLLEGRRVINNIERVASLYLVKIVYTIILVAFFTMTLSPYPYVPIQLTLMNALTIGIPSFIFAVANNPDPIKPRFGFRLLRNVLPGGVAIASGVLLTYVFANMFHLSLGEMRTFAVLVTGGIQFVFLAFINQPLKSWKLAMYIPLVSLFGLSFIIEPVKHFFKFESLNGLFLVIVVLLLCASYFTMQAVQALIDFYDQKRGRV